MTNTEWNQLKTDHEKLGQYVEDLEASLLWAHIEVFELEKEARDFKRKIEKLNNQLGDLEDELYGAGESGGCHACS